jgi:adenosine 3'-phospho 5'-phosphosulfate transporter B3
MRDGTIEKKKEEQIYLFGVLLSCYSYEIQLAICSSVLFFCFITFSYIQELVLSEQDFPFPWFVTLLQFVFYAVFAAVHRFVAGEPILEKQGSWLSYAVLCGTFVLARGPGNLCLKYIDFTTKILFQSSKVIPVMIIGVLLLNKRYLMVEYLATLSAIAGLFLFSLADSKSSSTTLSLLGIALSCCDMLGLALKSNLQEKLMSGTKASKLEVAFYCNLVGIPVVVPIMLLSGEFPTALTYSSQQPYFYLLMTLCFLFGYCGSICTLTLIKISDALVASMIGSARKVITIFLSFFLFFSKPFTLFHFVGSALFFGGLATHIGIKRLKAKRNEQERRASEAKLKPN